MRKILISILIAIAIFVIFIPQILSTSFGKPFFEDILGKKFDAKVHIKSVRLTWFGPQVLEKIEFWNPETTGSIDSVKSDVPLWSISEFGTTFSLINGFFFFSKYDNLSIGPINAKILNHDIQAAGQTNQGGHFAINGKVYSKMDFDLVANFTQMPVSSFDQIFKANGILRAGLGNSFDLSATIVYNHGEGHLNANFTSSHATASLKGQITQDALLLKDPFTGSLHLSQELIRLLKGRVLEPKNPITFRIETAGAFVPLTSFSLESLEIGQATLNLGQIVFKELHPLISLFALLNRNPMASSTAVVWFTPIEFSANKGLFQIGRTDFLIANSIHLCAWGNIKLPSGNLDLRLGIPTDTLEQTLSIQSLSRNYVLQIPVRGTFEDPVFETGPATAKIAALLAGKQITNKLSKKAGPLGGLLNQVTPQIGDNDKAPPAKRPFPWE